MCSIQSLSLGFPFLQSEKQQTNFSRNLRITACVLGVLMVAAGLFLLIHAPLQAPYNTIIGGGLCSLGTILALVGFAIRCVSQSQQEVHSDSEEEPQVPIDTSAAPEPYQTIIPKSDPTYTPLIRHQPSKFNASVWEPTSNQKFKALLRHIDEMSIPHQDNVFLNPQEKLQAYNFFKSALLYLHQETEHTFLKKEVMKQLSSVADGSFYDYWKAFANTIENISNFHLVQEENAKTKICRKLIHNLYARRRREIAESMASLATQPQEALNNILRCIGRERNIPGYQIFSSAQSITDADLLTDFDSYNTAYQLIEWFYKQINRNQNKAVQKAIHDYIAWYFDVSPEIVNACIVEDQKISKQTIRAILEISGIIQIKQASTISAMQQLEERLKAAVITAYNLEEGSGLLSAIEQTDWAELPLLYTLILSDKFVYDMREDSLDRNYLNNQLINGNTRNNLAHGLYSEEDNKLTRAKIKRLEEVTHPEEDLQTFAPCYYELEKLALDLAATPENNDVSPILPYLDMLTLPEIRNFQLPDLNDTKLENVNFYSTNLHTLAAYIWNGLNKMGYTPSTPPSEALKSIARRYTIDLL